jgi:hypothetical protein
MPPCCAGVTSRTTAAIRAEPSALAGGGAKFPNVSEPNLTLRVVLWNSATLGLDHAVPFRT